MKAENLGIGEKGVGGLAISGNSTQPDSSMADMKSGVTELTNGGDPYTSFKPKSVPGHLAELAKHSGAGVVKSGDSPAGVGPVRGK